MYHYFRQDHNWLRSLELSTADKRFNSQTSASASDAAAAAENTENKSTAVDLSAAASADGASAAGKATAADNCSSPADSTCPEFGPVTLHTALVHLKVRAV